MKEFKIGDEVWIEEVPRKGDKNYLGEGGIVTHQGPYIVEEVHDKCVRRISGITVCLYFTRFIYYDELTYEIY